MLPFNRGADDVQLGPGRGRRHWPREAYQNAGSEARTGRPKNNPSTLITVGHIEIRRLAGGLEVFDRSAHVHLASEHHDRFDTAPTWQLGPSRRCMKVRSILILSNGKRHR